MRIKFIFIAYLNIDGCARVYVHTIFPAPAAICVPMMRWICICVVFASIFCVRVLFRFHHKRLRQTFWQNTVDFRPGVRRQKMMLNQTESIQLMCAGASMRMGEGGELVQTERKPALHNLRDYIRRRARLAENDERLAPDFLRWNIEMEKRLAETAHKNVRRCKR